MSIDWIDLLHTTELGEQRIKRNLGLGNIDVVDWCKQAVLAADESTILRKGKNWYIHGDGFVLTIHAHNRTIITAHRKEK